MKKLLKIVVALSAIFLSLFLLLAITLVFLNIDETESNYLRDVKIETPKLPVKLSKYRDDFSIDYSSHNVIRNKVLSSSIEIDDVSVEIQSDVKITFYGKKTGGDCSYDFPSFGYKLLDADGYIVKRGTVLLLELQTGDKFKKEEVIYDLDKSIKPGQTYKLEIYEK